MEPDLISKKTSMEADLISELPDSILHHILSFLDMKYVISTSFLSRRWRYLWTSVPSINISDELYTQRSDIPTFRLHYNGMNYDIDKSNICLWISVSVNSNVKVLHLHSVSRIEKLDLPDCLFTCNSLTTLKLDMGIASLGEPTFPICILPNDLVISLPALKTLNLGFLTIVGDVGNLISSCPVLETLIMSNCKIKLSGNELIILAYQLKNLVIELILGEASSVDYCRIQVLAPKLTSFRCRDRSINKYYFVDSSSIVNAEIEAGEYGKPHYPGDDRKEFEFRSHWNQKYIKRLMRSLSQIYNVKSLMLSACSFKAITEDRANFTGLPIDPFCNLRLLKLKTSLSTKEILGNISLIKKCPQLETVVLKMVKSYTKRSKVEKVKDSWDWELAPECMMDHLKFVEIWDVFSSENELEFLKFLLKNAIILEKISVYTLERQPLIKLQRFVNKLRTFPAASSTVEISFCVWIFLGGSWLRTLTTSKTLAVKGNRRRSTSWRFTWRLGAYIWSASRSVAGLLVQTSFA